VDFFKQVFSVHGNASSVIASFQFISNDGYNLWTLVSTLKEGLTGRAAIFQSSVKPVIGYLTYQNLATYLSYGVIGILGLISLLWWTFKERIGAIILLAAAGIYGLVLFKTGLSSHHYMLALPLLLAAWKYLGNRAAILVVSMLTITTFVSMAGSLGYGGIELGSLSDPAISPVTRFFMRWYASDWFVTFGSCINVLIMVIIGWKITQNITHKERGVVQQQTG
jgi:hypothetical protein